MAGEKKMEPNIYSDIKHKRLILLPHLQTIQSPRKIFQCTTKGVDKTSKMCISSPRFASLLWFVDLKKNLCLFLTIMSRRSYPQLPKLTIPCSALEDSLAIHSSCYSCSLPFQLFFEASKQINNEEPNRERRGAQVTGRGRKNRSNAITHK